MGFDILSFKRIGKEVMNMNNQRSNFSGKLGFVLAAAGSAVGLGNIWRFPYLAAKYGGGIFLLIYLILVATFGYAMIVSESAIGRMTQNHPSAPSISWARARGMASSASAAGSTLSSRSSLFPTTP